MRRRPRRAARRRPGPLALRQRSRPGGEPCAPTLPPSPPRARLRTSRPGLPPSRPAPRSGADPLASARMRPARVAGSARWTPRSFRRPGDCPVCGMALEPEMPTAGGRVARARRHDAEAEGRDRARPAGPRPRDVGHGPGPAAPARRLALAPHARPGPPRDAGRRLGRGALLPARVGLPREPQPEHVHAHRPRRRGRVALQRRGPRRRRSPSRPRPRGLPGARRRAPRLLRGGRRHHGARPPRPGPRAEGPEPDELGHPRPPRPLAEDGAEDRRPRAARWTSPSSTSRRATASACGPASASRWTGRSRTGPPGSTSR